MGLLDTIEQMQNPAPLSPTAGTPKKTNQPTTPSTSKSNTAPSNPPPDLKGKTNEPSATSYPATEESTRLKDAGNTAMADKNYELAISLYTDAIRVDSNNLVAINNRAQAYLKVNKFVNAESDATDVLIREKEQPGYTKPNPKALFRRGTARMNIGGKANLLKALEDFEETIKVESNNKSAMTERAKVLQILADIDFSARDTKPPAPPASPPVSSVNAVGKRDVDATGMTVRTTTLKKKSSDVVSSASPKSPLPASGTSNAATNSTPEKAAVSNISSPVSNLSTPSSKSESLSPAVGSAGKKLKDPAVPSEPPKTLYELERIWRGLKTRQDLFARYLLTFTKSTFKHCFKEAVTPELLSSLLLTLKNEIVTNSPEATKRILEAMKSMNKFEMTISLLPAEDVSVLRDLIISLASVYGTNDADTRSLAAAYQVTL